MASKFTRIPRTKAEIHSFLSYNVEEYKEAYKNIQPGQGWKIDTTHYNVFDIMSELYERLYFELYPKLAKESLSTDKEIIDFIEAFLSWAEHRNREFIRLVELTDTKIFDILDGIVQALLVKAIYKLIEAKEMAEEELDANPKLTKSVETVNEVYLIGVVTTTDEEFKSFKSLLDFSRQPMNPANSFIYYKAEWQKDERKLGFVLVQCHHQGSAASAVATTQLIREYLPDMVVMLGHAAGNKNLKNSVSVGDIIICNESVDYDQVTVVERTVDGKLEFVEKDRKNPISADSTLSTIMAQFGNERVVTDKIKMNYELSSLFGADLKVHTGKIISGNALVRSEAWFQRIISDNSGVLGLDMEIYSFFYAAKNTTFKNKPVFIAIKSVSDFGENHNNGFAEAIRNPSTRVAYATYTSAAFFFEFATANLPLT